MAYKFQIGEAILSGSVTFKEGLSANDADISNVGDINVDSVSVDAAGTGLNIDFSGGNTGVNLITLGDNLADALSIKEGSNTYLKFITSNSAEKIEFMKEMDFGNQAMTNVNIDSGAIELTAINIDGGTALGGASLAQADLFIIDDGAGGTNKSVTFSNLEDSIFGNVSGDATVAAGGALTIANDAVEQAMIADDAVGADQLAANAVVNASIASGAAIDLDKLDGGSCASTLSDLAQGDLMYAGDVDDSNNIKSITFSDLEDAIFGNVSGDATIAAGGALTIAATSIEGSMLNNNVISGLTDIGGALATDDELMVSDGGTLRRMDLSRLSTMMQSTGLSDSSGQLSVAAAQTSITSIINSSMGKIGTDAAQEYIDFGTSNEIKFVVNNSAVASVEAGVFVVAGDLRVNGTTTSINSTTVNVSSSFTFEGPADAHETTLHAGGDGTGAAPQADSTLYLPALSAGSYYIPALADQATAASAAVTAAEFALLDGGSSVGTTALASGDGFLHNDGGTMKQTSVDKIADLFAGDGLAASSGVMALSIAGLSSELSSATLADTDEFAISDGGSMKKIDFQYVRDSVFADVSGDATVAAGGALTIANDAVEQAMIADDAVGADQLAASAVVNASVVDGSIKADKLDIDGSTDIGEALVNADLFIVDNGAGGTNRKCTMSRLKTYIGSGTAAVATKADGGTLAVGVNYFADMSDDGEDSVTLPASAGMTVGESVKVKAPSDCSADRYITINKAGSQTIDGATSIRLESPFAAVELVYVAADTWRVF